MNEPQPPLEAPQMVSLSRQIQAHLERLIFQGKLKSGQRLSEPEIAKWFNTSRSPVREALRHLEQSGLVTIEPRRGTSVKVPQASEMDNMLAVREALEGMAARLAAERASASDIAELRECLAKKGRLPGDTVTDFHEALLKASHNEHLETALRGSWSLIRMLRKLSAIGEGRSTQSIDEHRAILAAIEACDGNAAEEAARHHVRKMRADLHSAEAGGEPVKVALKKKARSR